MEEKQMLPEEQEAGGNKAGKADKTLLELSLGIFFWGIACQAVGIWLVNDKIGYSIGLWIGIVLATAAGIHMWWALDRSLDFASATAVKMMTKYNIIRYLAIVASMGFVMISGFANPLSAFLGLMGLKVAAYLQPFTHKICIKFYRDHG